MILRLGSEILENGLLPEPFHVVPVLDLTVADGVVQVVCPEEYVRVGCRECVSAWCMECDTKCLRLLPDGHDHGNPA
jgi:hypothetical protein